MGGYQQLVRGEPFRGKFRNSFEKPEPFVPGQPATITFTMPDAYHTFRSGHRVMVQVQSSWFPFIDRNPQTFVDIPGDRRGLQEADAPRLPLGRPRVEPHSARRALVRTGRVAPGGADSIHMSDSPSLLRVVGTRRLAATIFNTVVGAGIFALPGVIAA